MGTEGMETCTGRAHRRRVKSVDSEKVGMASLYEASPV